MSTFGAFTVTRASTKNVLGSNGLYQSVANDTPAFEFNTDGTYRGLLAETGATNLLVRSQEFDTTWTTLGSAVASNTTVAPDGATTGDTLTADGTETSPYVQQSVTVPSAGGYVMSVFAKAGTHNAIRISFSNFAGSTGSAAGFDLTAGTAVNGTIENVGNGWYRCSFSNTIAAGDLSGQIRIFVSQTSGTQAWSNAADNNGKSVILWQAQLESGPVATSYIVTTGGTASRVADSISLTSASSLIGQTGGGTLYVEVFWKGTSSISNQTLLEVSDGTASNRANLFVDSSSNELRMFVNANNVAQTLQGVSASSYTGVQKLALRYAQDDTAMYRNGVSQSTDTSVDLSALATLGTVTLGHRFDATNQANMWIRAVALYTTPLSNAQLASLTTL